MARKSIISIASSKDALESSKKFKNLSNVFDARLVAKEFKPILRQKVFGPMLRELRKEPPKRSYPEDYPIEYTSDKQRRYVQWLLKGKPYKRTGKTKRSWNYKFQVKNNQLYANVSNESSYSAYVSGNIGFGVSRKSVKRYLKPMQKFHIITGWKPAYKSVNKYLTKAEEITREKMMEILRKTIK